MGMSVLLLQAQLMDFVVENAEPGVTARLQERYELTTDSKGIAMAWLPPGAELSVFCHTPVAAEAVLPSTIANPQRHIAVSHRAAQFVGFELQQVSRIRVVLAEFGTGLPVAGASIRFVMAQDELGNLCDAELGVLATSAQGCTDWVCARTGALVRAEIAELPWKYLGMDSMERVCDQEQMLRLVDEHEVQWYVPKKPTVSVRVHDAASGERVIGIHYRVMCRPHSAEPPASRVSFGGTLLLDTRVCLNAANATSNMRGDAVQAYWLTISSHHLILFLIYDHHVARDPTAKPSSLGAIHACCNWPLDSKPSAPCGCIAVMMTGVASLQAVREHDVELLDGDGTPEHVQTAFAREGIDLHSCRGSERSFMSTLNGASGGLLDTGESHSQAGSSDNEEFGASCSSSQHEDLRKAWGVGERHGEAARSRKSLLKVR
jgi:hypothetical protein